LGSFFFTAAHAQAAAAAAFQSSFCSRSCSSSNQDLVHDQKGHDTKQNSDQHDYNGGNNVPALNAQAQSAAVLAGVAVVGSTATALLFAGTNAAIGPGL